jgi:hypothetical protein
MRRLGFSLMFASAIFVSGCSTAEKAEHDRLIGEIIDQSDAATQKAVEAHKKSKEEHTN